MYDWWHRPTSMCHVRGRLIRVRDSRPAARRRGRRPDVWAVAMVQRIQAAHAWHISRQSPQLCVYIRYSALPTCEMLDGQGDCNDITQNLAGLLACESLGQACKTHALQKTGKDSIHTCPVEMQGQTQANTQKASPFRLSNETFSCRMHTYARCCRPCERCQMSDDGGIACSHAACGILV